MMDEEFHEERTGSRLVEGRRREEVGNERGERKSREREKEKKREEVRSPSTKELQGKAKSVKPG